MDNPRLFRLAQLTLFLASTTWGTCVPPSYRIGRELANDKLHTDVNISIRLEDFAPGRLICLAGVLREKYPNRNILATFFSAYDAAKFFSLEVERTERTIYLNSKLHGGYVYDKGKGKDYIYIVPDGMSQESTSPFNTRINLPLRGPPVCKLALDGRCLLEFKHIDYPSIGGKTDGSGEVTVTGRIRPNGVVSDLKAVGTKADPPASESTLKEFTLGNLQTWRFATSTHESSLRITYRFALTDSALSNDNYVQFQLPEEVRIQTRR